MRDREKARKAAAVFAFQESLGHIFSFKASKKISALIALALGLDQTIANLELQTLSLPNLRLAFGFSIRRYLFLSSDVARRRKRSDAVRSANRLSLA
jgi:hypothetical protein